MTFTFVMVLTALVGLPGLRAQAPSNEFLVSEGKAGSIEVGMSVDEVLQAFGRARVRLVDLGVGSTLAELQRVRSVRVSREEGWSAIVPNAKISFGLEAVPGTTGVRVTLVRTWLDAKTVRKQRCPDR